MASQLAIVLSKITYRMKWDEWDLTEAEYKLIDNVRGPEIIETAYKNGLPISKLIENYTEIVEKHNERSRQQAFQDLKRIKLDLFSTVPRKSKEKPSSFDSDQIERRLAQETINEVVGLEPSEEPEDFINIESAMKERGIMPIHGFESNSKPKFLDTLPNASRADSPSLQRNRVSELEEPMNITIHEVPATNIPFVSTNDFGEAEIEEVANMGLFEGVSGRSLYNSFKARESFNNSIVERGKMSTPNVLANDIVVPPAPDAVEEVLPLMKALQTIENNEDLNELQPFQASLELIEVSNNFELPTSQVLAMKPQPQAANALVGNISDVPNQTFEGRSRLEQFQKKILELENQTLQKPKRRARLRRQLAVSPNRNVQLEANNPLMFHRRRSKKLVHLPKKLHKIFFEFCFEDLEDFVEDEIEEVSSESNNVIFSPVQPPVLEEYLPPNLDPATPVNKRRRIDITEESTEVVSKAENIVEKTIEDKAAFMPAEDEINPERPAAVWNRPSELRHEGSLNVPIEDFSVPELPAAVWNRPSELRHDGSLNVPTIEEFLCPDIIPARSSTVLPVSPLVEQSHLKSINTPMNAFQPNVASTSNLTKKSFQTVTNRDIEFALLQQASERSLQPNVPEKSNVEIILETLKKPKSVQTDDQAKENQPPKSTKEKPLTFRTVEGKSEMMIEMVVDGKVEQYSAYWMETMALYVQTRFLMNEVGTWKMKFEDVLSRVGLLKEKRPHIIETRYLMLAKYGFCKLTLDEDENHILEVEIPIKKKQKANKK